MTDIQGWYDPEELEVLTHALEQIRNKGDIVEVGVAHGRSAMHLLRETFRLRVPNRVHLFDNSDLDIAPDPQLFFSPKCFSFHSYDAQVYPPHEFGIMRVALLHVDADHEHESTLAILRNFEPSMVPGTILVFHDYESRTYPGVQRAVSDWVDKYGAKLAPLETAGCVASFRLTA
jgi:cephalosporin hydroxylase